MVSVLMTAFNRQALIGISIESVLNQDFTDFEFIIVDDASTDNTWEIILDYAKVDSRIKAYRNEVNLGDYPNRNKAASYASRKYLKYLDSDDILNPGGLGALVKGMAAHPSAAIGLLGFGMGFPKGTVFILSPLEAYRQIFFRGKIIGCGPSFSIIDRAHFISSGGFSNKPFLSDFEYWLKMLASFPVCIFDETLVSWRKHADQEFEKGEKSNYHFFQSYHFYVAALCSRSCPLPVYDIECALRNLKNRYARQILLHLVGCRFQYAFQIKRATALRLIDLFLCIIPNKYPSF